jgi:hypothetical protein
VSAVAKSQSSAGTVPADPAVPYRIIALETVLKDPRLLPEAVISIEPALLSIEEEKRLFPKFTLDRYYVRVQNRGRSFSISGERCRLCHRPTSG